MKKGFVKLKKRSKNKAVMNATPIKVADVQYRSKLEAYCDQQLKEAGITAAYEENKFILIPKFEYNGEKIQACTYTPDFVGKEFIIDTKGWARNEWKIKWKMFKQYLRDHNLEYDLYIPSNQTQVREVIQQILTKRKLYEDYIPKLSNANICGVNNANGLIC